jgi:hypothetical protein
MCRRNRRLLCNEHLFHLLAVTVLNSVQVVRTLFTAGACSPSASSVSGFTFLGLPGPCNRQHTNVHTPNATSDLLFYCLLLIVWHSLIVLPVSTQQHPQRTRQIQHMHDTCSANRQMQLLLQHAVHKATASNTRPFTHPLGRGCILSICLLSVCPHLLGPAPVLQQRAAAAVAAAEAHG